MPGSFENKDHGRADKAGQEGGCFFANFFQVISQTLAPLL